MADSIINEGDAALLACLPFLSAFIITDGEMREVDKAALVDTIDELGQSTNLVSVSMQELLKPNFDTMYDHLIESEDGYIADLNQIRDEVVSNLPLSLQEVVVSMVTEVIEGFFKNTMSSTSIDMQKSRLESTKAISASFKAM